MDPSKNSWAQEKFLGSFGPSHQGIPTRRALIENSPKPIDSRRANEEAQAHLPEPLIAIREDFEPATREPSIPDEKVSGNQSSGFAPDRLTLESMTPSAFIGHNHTSSFGSRSEVSMNKTTAGRSNVEHLSALTASTDGQRKEHKQPPDLLSHGDGGLAFASTLRAPGVARLEQATPRVTSQRGLIEDSSAASTPTAARKEKVLGPYTPSIYDEDVWVNDPRVGVSLPVFSPVATTFDEQWNAGARTGKAEVEAPRAAKSIPDNSIKTLIEHMSRVQAEHFATLERKLAANQAQMFNDLKHAQKRRLDQMASAANSRADDVEKLILDRFAEQEKVVKRYHHHNLELFEDATNERRHVRDDIFMLNDTVEKSNSRLIEAIDNMERRLTTMEYKIRTAHESAAVVPRALDSLEGPLLPRLNRRTPRTITTDQGSPIKLATHRVERDYPRPAQNLLHTIAGHETRRASTVPQLVGFASSPVRTPPQTFPSPVRTPPPTFPRLSARPAIPGPNGEMYEMPDFMMESHGLTLDEELRRAPEDNPDDFGRIEYLPTYNQAQNNDNSQLIDDLPYDSYNRMHYEN